MSLRSFLGPVAPRSTEPAERIHAWVSFNQQPTIWASENVLSVTDDGAGLYTITWTRALSASPYCVGAFARLNADDGGKHVALQQGTLPTSGSVQVSTATNNTGSTTDADEVCVVVIGR